MADLFKSLRSKGRIVHVCNPNEDSMHERVAADRESVRLKDIEIRALCDEKKQLELLAEQAGENERRREEEFRREVKAMRQATGIATDKMKVLSEQAAALREEISKQHSKKIVSSSISQS